MLVKPTLKPGSQLLLVGEAPGFHEEQQGLCFVGASGAELNTMLAEAGCDRAAVSLTNVFLDRPPGNDLNAWAISRKELKLSLDAKRPWRAIPCKKGVLPPARVQPALERLYAEIETVQPNVIVAMGNSALCALTGDSKITKARGTLHVYRGSRAFKVLPTYHPAAVLRMYDWRPVVIADLTKAVREAAKGPTPEFLNRRLCLDPTLDDLRAWAAYLCARPRFSVDIETRLGQITCVGFSPSPVEAFVVPFWTSKGSYWASAEEEAEAWKLVRVILKSPAIKVLQNGLYDTSYFAKYGLPIRNFLHDTMLLSHSLYPAMPKSLGFLGSLYCDERAWKAFRTRGGDTAELKAEE